MNHRTLLSMLSLSLVALCIFSDQARGSDEVRVKTRDRNKDGKSDVVIRETLRSGNIIKNEMEADTDGDGKVDMTYVKVFDGGKLIFFESWDQKSNKNVRAYSYAGKDLIAEIDKNNDGIFELIILFDGEGDVRTALTRTREGKIEVETEERLVKIKEEFEITEDFAESVKE